ncbi:MAG: leucine-rich repeat domain-containing protein [Oscillospiraceae bacterium]|jgi:hypothetical protein|nr:leucine-rich repeat domain-containing protein [Oscillospiraceae bacterium]
MNDEKILYEEDAARIVGENVVIPEGYTEIACGAFAIFEYLGYDIKTVTFPESLRSIGADAFSGNYSLKTVMVPKNLTNIDPEAFRRCDALVSYHVDSENPVYADVDGVLFCKDKTVLKRYPQGRKVKSYTVPDGVNSLGKGAFYHCDSITHISIPKNVQHIEDAFTFCNGLKTISVAKDNPVYSDEDGVLLIKIKQN